MMGTLAAALARKGIRTPKEVFRADVSGDIENVGGILKITKITVNYDLKVPTDKKQDAQEAFGNYLSQCPAAQSVIGCIEINHTLTLS